MKIIKCAMFAAFILVGVSALSHGWVFEQVPDKNVMVRYRVSTAANVSTTSVVIDLSNTTTWPHTATREINISAIKLEFDKAAASTGTAKLGVVTFVNSSTGSITWFFARESAVNASNTNISYLANFTPNFLKLKAVPSATPDTTGSTPYLLSNDKTAGSTTFQTDVMLPNPSGTDASPGLGDIVLEFTNGTAANIVSVEIQYHAE